MLVTYDKLHDCTAESHIFETKIGLKYQIVQGLKLPCLTDKRETSIGSSYCGVNKIEGSRSWASLQVSNDFFLPS